MNLLTIEHLTKSYTERKLFCDVGFTINEGDKIGLIGINGTGKSTLLQIAAGILEPDEGLVTRSRNLHIRFLPQNPVFHQGDTILESIVRDNEDGGHAWDIESQAKSMLTRLGFTDFEERVETLSGGQRKRVALVSVLLSHGDLLILDEPTNHLDSAMADWLETYLKRYHGALLMVTHDRYFLDGVTNRIVELDKGSLYGYQTNYEGYLQMKAQRLSMEAATERKRQSILKVELEWMVRGARARATKQKAHIARFEELNARKAPEADQTVELDSVSSRLGRTTVELQGIGKSFGSKVLMEDFTYIFLKSDRIGIIGPNGCGKSTLMKMIAGLVEPDGGVVTVGQTVKIGYFSQENEAMDGSVKVIDFIRGAGEFVRTKDGSISASQMLERFLFPSGMQYTVIDKLSGGEKRRLHLLRILMEAPNVLLLDEPTNDLDIETLTILEDYLDGFAGIVAAVSHDRYFLDRVVRRIFAFEGNGQVTQYEGGFTDYQAALEAKEAAGGGCEKVPGPRCEKAPGPGKEDTGKGPAGKSFSGDLGEKKLKFSFREQREWDSIEGEIGELEKTIADLDQQVEAAASDYGKLSGLMEEKARQEALLEEKMDRWVALNELAEQIERQKSERG